MNIRGLSCVAVSVIAGQWLHAADAFAPRPFTSATATAPSRSSGDVGSAPFRPNVGKSSTEAAQRRSLTSVRLSNNFDMSKPTFDLYSLRSIRGDALLRYNSLNQSEPLRINLYLLLTLSLLSYPAVSEAVVGEPATIVGTIASTVGAAFAGYRFVRECGRRSKKLNRMVKELNSERLTVRLPSGRFADRPYTDETIELRRLRGKRRILAIAGPAARLREAMVSVRTLRRRFVQASVVVVAVPTDGTSAEDWGVEVEELRSVPFLAQAGDVREWVEYFRSLVGEDEDGSDGRIDGNIAWFGLTNSGKSFGSGVGNPPRLIEILGQSLLPLEVLDEDDEAESVATSNASKGEKTKSILDAQRQFYDALTSGDLSGINAIYDAEHSAEVDEVLDAGGAIDAWDKCLEDGARPAGMKISGSDVLLASDTEAYSTAIEFPPVAGFDSATLLAVQKWGRSAADEKWKLRLHQTIPWSPDSRAGATLRCDCRGCTALTRGPERQWNFRGMID